VHAARDSVRTGIISCGASLPIFEPVSVNAEDRIHHMMPGQKEQAEILRQGLMVGTRTVADAVAWADAIIAADPQPDIAIIEVATSSPGLPSEVSALLRDVAGEYDPVTVLRGAMSDLRRALANDPGRGPEIARWLYELAISGELPEREFGWDTYRLENYFALASSGIFGTVDGAVRELDAYLERHARPSGLPASD
jgi:hypothetical protein